MRFADRPPQAGHSAGNADLRVAEEVAAGKADAGFGLRAAAARLRLDFVPLAKERYFLAAARRTLRGAPAQALLRTLRGKEFASAVRGLPATIPPAPASTSRSLQRCRGSSARGRIGFLGGNMHRRSFLQAGAAASLLGSFPRFAAAQQLPYDPRPAGWRTFEVTTRVEILKPTGASRVWVPVPSVESDYQKVIGNTWSGNGSARIMSDGKYGAAMVVSEWSESAEGAGARGGERFLDAEPGDRFRQAQSATSRSTPATAKFSVAPTELIPTDGIVRKTAYEITRGKSTDLQKARAIYDWIVDNTQRNPKTRGCGVGDIKSMLETGDLSGKCADLNALYVGLARAVNIPARDVYGLRVARSEFGYRSLGVGSPNVTRAQHCRAEVFLTGYGWVPIDPADVRKVVLEEKPQPTTLADPLVPPVRDKLFGAWEMNWVAYNEAHDVKLPGSSGPAVGFLMYPQAETGRERLDSLDPDNFKYTITAREIKA